MVVLRSAPARLAIQVSGTRELSRRRAAEASTGFVSPRLRRAPWYAGAYTSEDPPPSVPSTHLLLMTLMILKKR
jgi:hypothetical protein